MSNKLPRQLRFNTGAASSWDPETRQFTAVIVSGPGVVATANCGTRVTFSAEGLDGSGIEAGTVPLLHEHDRTIQLGKVLSLSVSGGRATVRCCLDPADVFEPQDEEADQTYEVREARAQLQALEKRLAAGTQCGFSMRAVDIEYIEGSDNMMGERGPLVVTSARIVEVSSTTMPGDQGATALSAPDGAEPAILSTVVSPGVMTKDTKTTQSVSEGDTKDVKDEVALSAPADNATPEPAPAAAPVGASVALSSGDMDALADRMIERQAKRQAKLTAEVNSVADEYELSAPQRQELLGASLSGPALYKKARDMDKANRSASLNAPISGRTSSVGPGGGNRVKETREAAFSVMEARVQGKLPDKEASKVFHPWDIPSILDIAQGMALSQGASLGNGGITELAMSALVRDDVPELMRELVNKALRAQQPAMAPVYSRLSVQRPVRDYSTIATAAGSSMTLTDRREGAETQISELDEEGITYNLELADTQKTLSHQIIVGDDIGWVQDLVSSAPRAVNASLERKFHESFTRNQNWGGSGTPIFDASRSNLVGGGNLNQRSQIEAAIEAMYKQVDLNGNPVDYMPRYMLVPPELMSNARRFLGQIQTGSSIVIDAGEVAAQAGEITIISSPWLSNSTVRGNSAQRWYLFAEPSSSRSIEHAVLERQPGPYFATRTETNRDVSFYLANSGAFAVANFRGMVRAG